MAYRYGGSHGMSSQDPSTTHNVTGPGNTSPPEPAKARIRDAAIELFGEHGFKAVSLKAIAEQAGVSAPLVIHHFGSKAELRKVCDRHVAKEFRAQKSDALEFEQMPRNYVLEAMRSSRPLVKYLLRAFLAGGEEMDALFDQLVEDGVQYTTEAVNNGLVTPAKDERKRVALLMMQQFGSLMMAHQMKRHLDFNPLTDDLADATTYISTALEIYTQPLVNAEKFGPVAEAFAAAAGEAPESPDDEHDP